ncbi:MAG: ATP-dependent zinc protease [Gammaproteobacteria bacterium]|nr:MAG: ATP-dependent zinc protease [Gammaproteobacteria bacterium]
MAVKAKIDTGARTSTLHAFDISRTRKKGGDWLRFAIHPVQHRSDLVIVCEAPVRDQREVRDSGGHRELRFVIETELRLGQWQWPVEVTLTSRDDMLFRMLVGRTALVSAGLQVDPGRSYLTGKGLLRLAEKAGYHQITG